MRNINFVMLLMLLLLGCNQPSSKNNKENNNTQGKDYSISRQPSTSSDAQYNSSEANNFPSNKYFQIANVKKAQYIKGGDFEMEFDVMNMSDVTFSEFGLSAKIYYKMKDKDDLIEVPIQFMDIKPKNGIVKNWMSKTTKTFSFITRVSSISWAYSEIKYNRTPENILLKIKITKAISIDEEIDGILKEYTLLDLWKERQKVEGLR